MIEIARNIDTIEPEHLAGLFCVKDVRATSIGPGHGTIVRAKRVANRIFDGAFMAVYFDCRVPCMGTFTARWSSPFACFSVLEDTYGLYVPDILDEGVPLYINTSPECAVTEFVDKLSREKV